jgi:predicted nucleic acid-binding Zn ribbon protein
MSKYSVRRLRLTHCDVCGKLFSTNKPAARFCSNKCRQVAYRKRRAAREEARRLQLTLWPQDRNYPE